MQDPRAGLAQSFREMSEDELMERWCGGYLTDIAVEVARAEFARRGVQPPAYVASQAERPAAGEAQLVEVARSQELGELEVLGARLKGEGIPVLIVNANTNRMGPQFANAAGGARLLVPAQFAADARQILALVRTGAFALREGEEPS